MAWIHNLVGSTTGYPPRTLTQCRQLEQVHPEHPFTRQHLVYWIRQIDMFKETGPQRNVTLHLLCTYGDASIVGREFGVP